MKEETKGQGQHSEITTAHFPPFSVSMCVYGGDNADWFDIALYSVINQTLKPSEIVLVVDGPIPDTIQFVIHKYEKDCRRSNLFFNVIYLEKNQGHGVARRTSVSNCSSDFIALMDADDISVQDRFELELGYLIETGADVVGGDIAEFIGEEANIVGRRCVPKTNIEIRAFMKKRCPFNQMTVMFRKDKYEQAGGYLDWFCDEDYYLWIRMALNNAVFANTGLKLVSVRVGREMYQRRGGLKYFRSEAKLQKLMLKEKIISFPRYIVNVGERLVLQVLLPNKMRGWFFQKFARS